MKRIIVWLFFIIAVLFISVSKSIPKSSHTGKVLDRIELSDHVSTSYYFNVVFDSTSSEQQIRVSSTAYNTYKVNDRVTFKVHTNRDTAMILIFAIMGLLIFGALFFRWMCINN